MKKYHIIKIIAALPTARSFCLRRLGIWCRFSVINEAFYLFPQECSVQKSQGFKFLSIETRAATGFL